MSVSTLAEALSQLSVHQQQGITDTAGGLGAVASKSLYQQHSGEADPNSAQSQMLLAGLQFSQSQQQEEGNTLVTGLGLYGDASSSTGGTNAGAGHDASASCVADYSGLSTGVPAGSQAQSSAVQGQGSQGMLSANAAAGSSASMMAGGGQLQGMGQHGLGGGADASSMGSLAGHGHMSSYMGGPMLQSGMMMGQASVQAAAPQMTLPNCITVTPSTDPMQAAGLINFTFAQSSHVNFVLNCSAGNGSTSVAVMNAALKLVLNARKICQQAMRFDLGFVPYLVTDTGDSMGLLLYRCSISPELAKARGQVLKVASDSNPLVAGLSLFNMLQSSTQPLEIIFTAEAAKVALQALSVMRINLANNGRDVLLLASTIEYAADAAGLNTYFLLKLTPTSPPLPCFQHQIELPKVQQATFINGGSEQGMMGRIPGGAGAGIALGFDQRMAPGMVAKGHAPVFPAMGAGAKQTRARKADYVIVTEDTAIKNAAGAVAKVLGRVYSQGICCPMYTEKKTESFTTVISVAVKAIAVARGYVCNEGMGHEVGFQPYLRNLDKSRDLLDLHQYMMDKKLMQLHKAGMPGQGGKPLEQLELNLDEESMHDERCELAFDVYKVPQMAELQDANNLPVKVTAHSRPNVVSNIIAKLVGERDGAVLITAGGKAMHVAMTAVVSARARLKTKGIDVLLMPKFVTVDTTSTLGWESVFLRFNIIRWSPPAVMPQAGVAGADMGMMPSMVQQGQLGMSMGVADTMVGLQESLGRPAYMLAPALG